MNRQLSPEADLKLQELEFLKRRAELNKRFYSSNHFNTCHRPFPLSAKNRQAINNEKFTSSEKTFKRPFHTNNVQKLRDQSKWKNPHSAPHSNGYVSPIRLSKLESPNQSKSKWTSSYSVTDQKEPKSSYRKDFITYNEPLDLQQSMLKALNVPQENIGSESIIEWFDRTVESELQKRRAGSAYVGERSVKVSVDRGKRIDVELSDAIDKYAKAEAIVQFQGAVRAAERAANNAPPELVEEAAAAGAKNFQAELTGVIKQKFPGVKPIEVIGYVGITRPRKPKKSNFTK